MKSGNYLSSRQLTASTFGVKELNFCVRNGNRWILFAIITAIAIYLLPFLSKLHILIYLPRRLTTTQQFLLRKTSFPLGLVKIIEFLVVVRSVFLRRSYSISLLRKLRSSPRPISIGQLLHCCIYTSDLSTLQSTRGLTSLCCGIPYLEASFTLRCFQRLSQPHSATLLCRWRDNRCTVGAFIPVLSY